MEFVNVIVDEDDVIDLVLIIIVNGELVMSVLKVGVCFSGIVDW